MEIEVILTDKISYNLSGELSEEPVLNSSLASSSIALLLEPALLTVLSEPAQENSFTSTAGSSARTVSRADSRTDLLTDLG